MNIRLAVLLLLPGCAWVTDAELEEAQSSCDCPDAGLLLYPDLDGDGFGDGSAPTTCPEDENYLTTGEDCDDSDAAVHPGAEELCNGLDDDCDGDIDSADAIDAWRWYQDADGDGYGDTEAWTMACDQPEGHVGVSMATDCDDGDDEVSPDASEICGDGKDNDCDGTPGRCRREGAEDWDENYLRFQGKLQDDGTGMAMAGGVDLIGDSYPDLMIGASKWSSGTHGIVAVFAGPYTSSDTIPISYAITMLDGGTVEPGVGRSLAVLGDMTGHGSTWIAVGASPPAVGGSAAGAVYLLEAPLASGTVDLANKDVIALEFSDAGDAFGFALTAGLDASGNGFPDLVVGAPGANAGAGEALYFEGPVSRYAQRVDALAIIAGEASADTLGSTVQLVPDLDGDGLADLAIGAPCGGDDNEGQVSLFLSPVQEGLGLGDAAEVYSGEGMNHLMGVVAAAGDVDADGHGDLLLAAPYGGKDQAGVVYLVLGATNPVGSVTSAEATITGSIAGATFGAALAGLDDFDADGYGDVLIGAPKADSPDTDAGVSYLFYGSFRGNLDSVSADFTISGPDGGAHSGSALSPVGDLNRDGFSDVAIGAPKGSVSEAGILFGTGW